MLFIWGLQAVLWGKTLGMLSQDLSISEKPRYLTFTFFSTTQYRMKHALVLGTFKQHDIPSLEIICLAKHGIFNLYTSREDCCQHSDYFHLTSYCINNETGTITGTDTLPCMVIRLSKRPLRAPHDTTLAISVMIIYWCDIRRSIWIADVNYDIVHKYEHLKKMDFSTVVKICSGSMTYELITPLT